MHETVEQFLLAEVRKCAQFVVRGIVTGREFTNKVCELFASFDVVYPQVVPDLWAAVPDSIRSEFAEAIRDAAHPDFRYGAFYFGGGRPMTEEELRKDAELCTAHVQAWAREFVRFLAGVEV